MGHSGTDRAWVAGILSSLLLALGCALTPQGVMTPDEISAKLVSQGLDPDSVVIPFAINEEMRVWAHDRVGTSRQDNVRLELLLEKLLDPSEIALDYQAGYTATAEEVFENRTANCLAFTNLFVGISRELHLPVYFLRVEDVERFRREGDLVVVSGHVAAAYGYQTERVVLDFAAEPVEEYRLLEPISDLEAIAIFHSNRGAETLAGGDVEGALFWLERAVRMAPDLDDAWINLGVAYRRNGELDRAEGAYRRALEMNPSALSAYSNLSSLLRLRGREEEAAELLELADSARNRNPYTYLSLGDLALKRGRLQEAQRYYEKARKRFRDNAEPYAALGLVAFEDGDAKAARRWLKKATKLDPSDPRTAQLKYLLAK